MNDLREMVLCIPGPWQSRAEAIRALVDAHGGRYLMAGLLLYDSEGKDSVTIEWEEHDPRMVNAFYCCQNDEKTMSALASHGSVLYLRFPMDITDQRERLLKYTDVLRKAGGIAVKLESSGISHPWSRWFEWLSSPFLHNHYRAAVIVAGDADGWYSCGMHQFGLPGATVPGDGEEVRETLEAFNKYLLIENPKLSTGHTFSKDADCGEFVTSHLGQASNCMGFGSQ